MKKALILYDTVYGNTKKIAMSLSRGLEAGGIYVDSNSIQNFEIKEMLNYDIIGIGGPTHFHGISKNMKTFLNKIKHLKMEDKYGFIFETKADFRLSGSAAKQITRFLKKMKMEIIYPIITGIVLHKEGPLQEFTSDIMEQTGLNISEKVNNNYTHKDINEQLKNIKNPIINLLLNRFKWIFLGGGPIFFFIRALYLACIGGDCFGTINLIFSWFLLLLEIFLSGIAWSAAIASIILWKVSGNQIILQEKINFQKIVLIAGIITYVIHFIRVAIWIFLCVI
ncbi:MAG: flavodoxin domain-containing protein [Promethearchaeota archaeon]